MTQISLPVHLFPLSLSFHDRSTFSFPCQCHSTIALHSVSPVSVTPPSLYIQFPLSVSLHHRSIFSFPCQCHSTIAPHSHSTAAEAARCIDQWSIQLMQPGDLAHPGLSPQQFSYSHVATHTMLCVHISYFLNRRTVPWCIELRLYPTAVPIDPAVVRWSA